MSKPLLRWAGSKRQMLPILSSAAPDSFHRYLEPFAGSACLFFHLNPKESILGDINAPLIETYRTVRRWPNAVANRLSAMERSAENYYQFRAANPKTISPSARAARFIYLNRLCFNGLYRTNADGCFNVPYGGAKSGALPSSTVLADASQALTRCRLICGDFSNVLRCTGEGDFVYMDPPYRTAARRTFREYDALDFSAADLERLKMWLELLDKRGATFLVSYAESEEGHMLASGYHSTIVEVTRNISGFIGSRGRCNELLISNRALTL